MGGLVVRMAMECVAMVLIVGAGAGIVLVLWQ
jgi:hypothetical protein